MSSGALGKTMPGSGVGPMLGVDSERRLPTRPLTTGGAPGNGSGGHSPAGKGGRTSPTGVPKKILDASHTPMLSKLQSTHHQQQSQAKLSQQFSSFQAPAGSSHHLTVPTIPGTASLALGTSSAQGKLKSLEESLEKFPVEKPGSAGNAFRSSDDEFGKHRSVLGATAAANAEKELKRLEKENASKRFRADAAKATFEHARKHRIDAWVQLADRNNRKLRRENDALAKVAQLTQENCINNDARYEETLNGLRSELEYTSLYRQDSAETLNYVWEAVGSIQDRIVHMKSTAERQAQADFARVKQELETLLDQKVKDLEEVRQSGSNTTGEWVTKNQTLQNELEALLYKIDALYTTNQELRSQHKKLQVEHGAQAGDGAILEKQFHAVSVHHQRLKDRIHDLELELASQQMSNHSHSISGRAGDGGDDDLVKSMTSAQKGLQSSLNGGFDSDASAHYASSLKKAQVLLETEAENLSQVRAAHVQALKQRTELEVFLRQAILHYIRTNKERLTSEGYNETSAVSLASRFTAQDRRILIERLLMKPRVLQLMYHEETAGTRPKPEEFDRPVSADDIETLWKTWQSWTAAADEAMKVDPPKTSW